jgi:RimJ/RimL family protein N-acetyltransferase
LSSLNVREIEIKDIEPLLNYWFNLTPKQLIDMGADINKLPSKKEFLKMLTEQINAPIEKKQSYAVIWELYGKQIGHTNVNQLKFGESGTMHLHLWQSENRKKGIGTTLIKKSLPFYFKNLKLKTLFCEPYALNPAPNKTLEKIGFRFEKKYTTIPGSLNFEQEVNRWTLTKENYLKLML